MTMATPDETRARLRAAGPDELHAWARGPDHRDASLAFEEIARRKHARTYRLPRLDEPGIRWLAYRAHAEFGSRHPDVAALLLLLHRARRGDREPHLVARGSALLRTIYAGSDAALPPEDPGPGPVGASGPPDVPEAAPEAPDAAPRAAREGTGLPERRHRGTWEGRRDLD